MLDVFETDEDDRNKEFFDTDVGDLKHATLWASCGSWPPWALLGPRPGHLLNFPEGDGNEGGNETHLCSAADCLRL